MLNFTTPNSNNIKKRSGIISERFYSIFYYAKNTEYG